VEHIGALVESGGHGAGVLERQDGPFDFVPVLVDRLVEEREKSHAPPGGDLAGVDDVAGQVAQLDVVVL
jgi:hypothetical protein